MTSIKGSPEPAPEVARRVLALARPYARELGGEAPLAGLDRLLRIGNGAERQRHIHAEGRMPALLEYLASKSGGAAEPDGFAASEPGLARHDLGGGDSDQIELQ